MKKRIAVVYGGVSAEREISLITGKAIFDNLDRKKYVVSLVELAAGGKFFEIKKGRRDAFDFYGTAKKRFDLVFIALHGTIGEDGALQGTLEVLGVPYTGSGVLASALGMSKVHAAAMYREHDIPTPDFVHFTKQEWSHHKKELLLLAEKVSGFPAVIKPADQGSAVGVSIVKDRASLERALAKTFKEFSWLIVQKFVKGREATCGVLEKNGTAFALPPTRIIANFGEFYDYASKYKAGGSTHVCPADFAPSVNAAIQDLALRAHRALGCRGMSRTDIFVADNGALWVIETNTIPGMTPMSLLPEAAGKAGIAFPKMLDLIVASSLRS